MSDSFENIKPTRSNLTSFQDLDISGLSPKDAREYVARFIASRKEVEHQRETVRAELNTWQERSRLSESHGRSDLKAVADTKISELTEKENSLTADFDELSGKIEALKHNLMAPSHQVEPTVDAEGLLAQMQDITGPVDESAQAFKEFDADEALRKLKEKMS